MRVKIDVKIRMLEFLAKFFWLGFLRACNSLIFISTIIKKLMLIFFFVFRPVFYFLCVTKNKRACLMLIFFSTELTLNKVNWFCCSMSNRCFCNVSMIIQLKYFHDSLHIVMFSYRSHDCFSTKCTIFPLTFKKWNWKKNIFPLELLTVIKK